MTLDLFLVFVQEILKSNLILFDTRWHSLPTFRRKGCEVADADPIAYVCASRVKLIC